MKKIIAAMLAVMLIMTAFSGVSWAQETVNPAPFASPSASSVGENAYDDIEAAQTEASGTTGLAGETELPADSQTPADGEAPGESEAPGDSETPVLNGWQTDASGETFYYQDGVMLKGWQTIDGEIYYFGKKTGKLYRGWHTIGGNRYYLGRTTGKLYTGIHKIRGNVYTFDESGVLLRTVYGNKKAICLTYDDGPSGN
ncbi:MAG: N-acetylmuramoyl-L-alanine amidase family protein, partial [Anaerovoracaceae bacterium]